MASPSQRESQALLSHSMAEGWWFRAKEDIVKEMLRPYLRQDSAVLVVGTGNGSTVRRLRQLAADCSIVGWDIDASAVALCRSVDPRGTYLVVDVEEEWPVNPCSFDVAIALDVLEHLQNDRDFVRRTVSLLKPSGILAINVPAHQWLFGQHDISLGHARRYSARQLESLIEPDRMELLTSTPLFMTTMIALVAWRKVIQPVLRLRSDRSDVDLRLPAALDHALYLIARAEAVLAPIYLPFGSSHFVLARRMAEHTGSS